MPGYISEYQYMGLSDEEFIEVAVPTGTDVSAYSVVIYQFDGTVVDSFPLGSVQGTYGGQDVYVINNSTPGFDSMVSMGEIYSDDALALVDDTGTVVQFISHWDNTVTAIEGPAAGTTSIDVGTASGVGESLQSDDGGATYYAQTATNMGSIPACFAPDTQIQTPQGFSLVQDLKPGDLVTTLNKGVQPVRWVWSAQQNLADHALDLMPVLIKQHAFARDIPRQDLIVSGQHRIVLGLPGHLDKTCENPVLVPAKALTKLASIRHMAGRKSIRWHHFACDDHCLVTANNLATETLMIGSEFMRGLNAGARKSLFEALGHDHEGAVRHTPALPIRTVRQTRDLLADHPRRRKRRKDRAQTQSLPSIQGHTTPRSKWGEMPNCLR